MVHLQQQTKLLVTGTSRPADVPAHMIEMGCSVAQNLTANAERHMQIIERFSVVYGRLTTQARPLHDANPHPPLKIRRSYSGTRCRRVKDFVRSQRSLAGGFPRFEWKTCFASEVSNSTIYKNRGEPLPPA